MGIDISLYIKTKELKTPEELLDLNYKFLEACSIGDGKQPISLDDGHFVPKDGYNYYSVWSLSRYYGVGYARGAWDSICMAIEWLRLNFKDSEILYGGDCSADECPIFTIEDQKEMTEYWAKNGGISYRQRKPDSPNYEIDCPNCKKMMSQFMWCNNGGGIRCLGCKYTLQTKDGGENWEEIKR